MNKKKVILIISIFIGVIVLALASSYAIFTINVTKNTDFKIVLGHLELEITDTKTEDKYILENIVPTKDSDALKEDGYTFTVTNTGTMDSYYTVYLDDIILDNAGTRLNNDYVKVNLYNHTTTRSDTKMLSDYPEIDRVLASGTLNKGESITYTLRMWIDYNAGNDAQSKYMATQIRVVGEQLNALVYQEEILKGADPVLTENLIPVVIDDNGVVTKANIKEEWYSYKEKKWANAVVLKEENVIDYSGNSRNAVTVGEPTYSEEGLVLDGVDDGIYLDNLLTDLFKSSNTVQIKLKRDETNVRDILLGNYYGTDDPDVDGVNYEIRMKNTYRVWVDDIASDLENGVATYNKYLLITYIFDKDNNNVYVYENNTLVATMSSEAYSNYNRNFNKAYIGRDSRTGETALKGTIERVMIYDDILTPNEIKQNIDTDYAKIGNDNGVVEDNLLLFYDFRKSSNDVYTENNTVIDEDAIESYFVWIPKYSYKLWDLGNYSSLTTTDSTKPHAIPIKFGLTNTSDSNTGECTTPGIAGESGNCKVGDYMTHPAFLAFDTNGLWVGKFETGYDGATSSQLAEVDSNESNKIIIKPNVYSWRLSKIGNMFKTSYDYIREDESHMMKNTEWGAVAYLHHSNYGTSTSLRVNNNVSFITGYSAINEPTLAHSTENIEENRIESTHLGQDGIYTLNYFNNLSNISSTTGNYTGIYDMSGGSWEYIMGYSMSSETIGSSSEITSLYNDFYTNNNWNKYYDTYSSASYINYNNRILGDATGEIGPFWEEEDPDKVIRSKNSWYKDRADFTNSVGPWFTRGGYSKSGTEAGIFAFFGYQGDKLDHISFRIVLAPTE